ncbi:ATP synthase F0 subunit C [Lacipirellula limnantheis]|uniref:ATP synthase subunit c n=1 Tax=Lacipirellula limnantheis TaxID=2528024 RepID=A0A517U087_9BACT|nr:ATP synthase F0 subunit C [Lacipirellula limnantheis]QDT74013.1 ATP synthase subunit c [Lacipirellula limnantheis]
MTKVAKLFALCLVASLALATPAWAQEEGADAVATAPTATAASDWSLITFSGAFGAALTTIGAAYGIGKLASAALESMARQPEVAGNIQTAMIIAAALIEGFTFFALFICMQQNPWAG